MPAVAAGAGVAASGYAAAALTAPPTASPPARGETLGGVVLGPFPEDQYPPERRRRWPWVLLVLALLCLVGGGVAAYLLTRPAKVVVPPVTGEQFNTARTQLQNDNLAVSELPVTSAKPAGLVISQDPQAGTKVKENTTVALTVSTGPGNATVPSVVGESLTQAKSSIQMANLKVGRVEYQASTTVQQGQVIGTSPQAGQTPAVDTPVTIFVSTGPPPVRVPDVTGEAFDQAKAQLEGQPGQFTVTETLEVSTTIAPGTVISQSPVGGSSVKPGSTIDLVVAKAPPTVAVPNVVGDKRGAAEAALGAAGFPASVQRTDVTTKSQGGIVLSQSPAAGTMVNKNTTVTIVVGHYVAPTPTTTTTTTVPTTTTPTTPTTSTTGTTTT
jgi:serine/threonine-protein kinase